MVKKYCEPCLYNSMEFDGTIVNSTLTISKIYWGQFSEGMTFYPVDPAAYSAVFLAQPTFGCMINSASSVQADGTGTYNLQVTPGNTNGTVRFFARGGSPLRMKPIVGAAQEGDGTKKGAGAPPTALINLAGYSVPAQASNNNSISLNIAGINITASNTQSSSGSATTFNTTGGLSGASLATALANAINNCQVAITPTGPYASWRATQLRTLVYAFAEGANLRVQSRVATEVLNNITQFQCVTTGFTGGAQITQQFSGGVGGAWGMIMNSGQSAMVDGTVGSLQYGIWGSAVIAGSFDPGDDVYIKSTAENDRDAVVPIGGGNNGSFNATRVMGTASAPVNFIVDDGTEWPTSNPTPTLRLCIHGFGGHTYVLFNNNGLNAYYRIVGKRYANGNANISWETVGGAPGFDYGLSPIAPFECMDMTAVAGSSGIQFAPVSNMAQNGPIGSVRSIRIKSPQSRGFFNPGFNSNFNYAVKLYDSEIDNSGNPSPHTGVFLSPPSNSNQFYHLENFRFKGFVSGSRMFQNAQDNRNLGFMRFIDCDYPNLAMGPVLSIYGVGTHTNRQYVGYSKYGNKELFADTMHGFYDWSMSPSYPTLNARMQNGVQQVPWVIRATPTVVASQIGEMNPLELPRIAKINTLDTVGGSNRTLTLNFAANDAIANVNKATLSFLISYESSDGGPPVSIQVQDRSGAPLTPAPEAQWSDMLNGKVRYGNADHSPYKMVFTTTRPIKAGAEIVIVPRIHTSVQDIGKCFFFDPEILVT